MMDVSLFRKPAMRHLLFHRFQRFGSKETTIQPILISTFWAIFTLAILDAFIICETSMYEVEVRMDKRMIATIQDILFKPLFLSLSEYLASVFTCLPLMLFCKGQRIFWDHFLVAVLSPQVFLKVAYLFFLIWDNDTEIVLRSICLFAMILFAGWFRHIRIFKWQNFEVFVCKVMSM